MKNTNVTDRLLFLAEEFDIFEVDKQKVGENEAEFKAKELADEGWQYRLIRNSNNECVAIWSVKQSEKNRFTQKISISSEVFASMISADPTENKMYLQWMLTTFTRLLKIDLKEAHNNPNINPVDAIRFIEEDLPQASVYLMLFDDNKRKKKFKELCRASTNLKHITDPTNINQYKSLSELFDVIDPFIDKKPSSIERTMHKFVDSGQAIIPVRDRKFTVYIPLTTSASVIFESFTSWCTARSANGMFKSYTEGHKKPNGRDSSLYIIIDNNFFTGKSEELYQLHFENKQIKNRKNSDDVEIYSDVLSHSVVLSNYFYEELMGMAKAYTKGTDSNMYLDYLIEFGFPESLLDIQPIDTFSIRIERRKLPKLGDLSRFKSLDELVVISTGLVELHPSIGNVTGLEILILRGNKLKTLPSEIGNLKKLHYLNLFDNPIESFPNSISQLDKSNGGSLGRLDIKKGLVPTTEYNRLKKLLPNTEISFKVDK